MTDAVAVHLDGERQQTPLLVRARWAYRRARRAMLPRPWVIRREMREHGRIYARARAEARAKRASRLDLQALEAEEAHFYWELEEELEMLESNRLLALAGSYMLPTPDLPADLNDPDGDAHWRRGTTYKPNLYLKREAMQELRAKIRAERKARLEPVGEWVKILGAIIGGAGGAWFLAEKVIALLHH